MEKNSLNLHQTVSMGNIIPNDIKGIKNNDKNKQKQVTEKITLDSFGGGKK